MTTPPMTMPRRTPALLPTLLLGAALALGACQTSGDGQPVSGNLLPADGESWQGATSKAVERAQLLARTPEEWEELWARVGEPAPHPLPAGRMAAALFLGTRDTAGFSVAIDSAVRKGEDLVIGYHEQVPGPAQAVAQMQTSPYAIRLLPTMDGRAVFKRVE
ncbi:protease complex subunit PrcB family protein [Azospirillum sp. SYSU D00513]|uniref:protease complex subunit PrcB family protein n=1 Tax=Azospirillum sp. SYSU D00513 TaxID=2812561 RepID=UPI001FFF566E|nr:protease complex subunit PrcB family protein [Azospirillum sp. SYSU D00513]